MNSNLKNINTDGIINEVDKDVVDAFDNLFNSIFKVRTKVRTKSETVSQDDDKEFKPIMKKMMESEAKMAKATRVLLDIPDVEPDFDLFGRGERDEEFV